MRTVALELVPPEIECGETDAARTSTAAAEHCDRHGLTDRIGHVMIPGIVPEDANRPVALAPRLDALDFWEVVRESFHGVSGLCAQVTVFDDEQHLSERVRRLRAAGIDGITFVGKPHGVPAADAAGITPEDAVAMFRDAVPHRGIVLIPTRRGELDRFAGKCERGATFALTQLLYSDRIVNFLRSFAARTDHRPEILLSFGFVPGIEARTRLIDWLVHDDGNDDVAQEQAFVAHLAASSPRQRRGALVDLYRRIVDGVGELGFPMSVNLESPYGLSDGACETFAAMLDYWSPRPATATS
ncbi:hypothetical protein C8K36_108180 [Rhodococcus sp. OK519]|uniref:mycobacterial-type methylenetetrahydrofolate reductase n=1 Tax=Rhodococcus sp. OK519 TaxID=2135729 RepID=UPI000D350A36|nr:hypothetical protein C8K36_108180 [Rhodococcus sp. OK519]